MLTWLKSAFVALWANEILLFMAMWFVWNYTPLCLYQLLCCFLSSPKVVLPREGWFIERLHCNSYMFEGPTTQIAHGHYVLKACPQQCNKKPYCTYEWLPFIYYVCFLCPDLIAVKYMHMVNFFFQFAHEYIF